MTTPVPQIIKDFYDAAWDLAGNLIYLRNKAVQATEVPFLNIQDITARFRQKADPFLNLTGTDLPQDLHLPFMEIEEILDEAVFPALTDLDKEWQTLYPTSPSSAADINQDKPRALRIINKDCADLANIIEIEIIARASTMRP